MKICRPLSIFCALLLLSSPGLRAQNSSKYEQQIIDNFIIQSNLFPQEKLHLQTDKPSYISGERIWFKAFVVNSLSHEPLSISKYVYVELVNPLNTVVRRVKILNNESGYNGYLDIPEDLAEGGYSLRAYTHFMRNMDENYFARIPVYIANPEVLRYDIQPVFSENRRGGLEVTLRIDRQRYGDKIDMNKFDIKFNNEAINRISRNDDKSVRFSVKDEGEGAGRVLYVGYDSYRKFFHVPYPENEFDVAFFPEGGNIIAGTQCRVAFKAVQPDGTPHQIKGTVRDAEGRTVAYLNTLHDGMGVFVINCKEGEQYTAVCETESGFLRNFTLPVATGDSYSLSVEEKEDFFRITLIGPSGSRIGRNYYLLAHTRGYPIFVNRIPARSATLTIPKEELPSGVIHLLLIDRDGNIISERLFFSLNNKDLQPAEITPDKPQYGLREKVNLTVQLDTPQISPASLSIAVTDDQDVDADKGVSIVADLLLASDLRGHIHSPDQYFKDGKTAAALDLVMLVHGWRRYNVPAILRGEFAEPQEALEVGQEISGTVRALGRRKPSADTEVSIISPQRSFYEQAVTDENGEFYLRNFDLPDSTTFVIQAIRANGRDNVEVTVNEVSYPDVQLWIEPLLTEIPKEYIEKSDRKFVDENGMRIIDIDKIEVRGQVVEYQKGFMSDLADASFNQRDIDELDATCMHELLRRIAGVYVFNNRVYVRGKNSIYGDSYAAIYVDGVYVDWEDYDLDSVLMPDVARVDVFKTGSTNVFGARGGNGVVSITTKKGDFGIPDRPEYNVKRTRPLGYQIPAEFYSPRYDTVEKRNNPKQDLRTTIYWNPSISVDESGRAALDFWSADYNTTYTVKLEGVTDEGKIVLETAKITVR